MDSTKAVELIAFTSLAIAMIRVGYPLPARDALVELVSFSQRGNKVPDEIVFVDLLAKSELAKILTYHEYWQHPNQFLLPTLTLESFQNFSVASTMEYFRICVEKHERDLQGFKVILSLFMEVLQYWRQNEKQRAMDFVLGGSYISSSFGRSADYQAVTNLLSTPSIEASFRELWKRGLNCIDFTLDSNRLFAPEHAGKYDAVLKDLMGILDGLWYLHAKFENYHALLVSNTLEDSKQMRRALQTAPC